MIFILLLCYGSWFTTNTPNKPVVVELYKKPTPFGEFTTKVKEVGSAVHQCIGDSCRRVKNAKIWGQLKKNVDKAKTNSVRYYKNNIGPVIERHKGLIIGTTVVAGTLVAIYALRNALRLIPGVNYIL